MAGTWQRLAHVELSSDGDTIDTGTFTAKENLKVIGFIKATTLVRTQFQFNSDTGSNYANRNSANGASDSTNTSMGRMYLNDLDRSSDCYFEANIINKSDEEKLVIYHDNWQNATGVGTAPMRTETTGKWANTSAQITSIQLLNDRSGDFASGSYMTVFGASEDTVTDEKTTLTNVPANTRYEETDTRKIWRRQVSNASYESDFSTNSGNDAWVTSNSSNYNINSSSSGKLYGVGNNDGTDFIYHDMQLNLGSGTNLSDTAFVIRIKNLKWGAVDETYQHWTFGCSDSNTNPRVSASDAFGMHQAKTGASSTANASFDMSGTAFSYSSDTGAPSISTDNQNIELIRDGTNISMTCYGTDDTFTTKVGSTVTKAIGSATNIRYIMFFDKNEHTATTNSFTVEAVNVYNGTTSAKDAKWIERNTA